MKNLIVALGLTMVIIISAIIIAALNTNTAQQNKLDNAVELAAYQTLNEFFVRDVTLDRTKENITDRFKVNLKELLKAGDTDAKYKIEIYGIDTTKGMLSVKVTETYKNIIYERTIDSETTVIYEATTS